MSASMNRVPPILPVTAVKTYSVSSPIQTHRRSATCAEVDCSAWRDGWATRVDPRTELGAGQAYYVRHDRSRRHREEACEDGTVRFVFEPGQRCFRQHSKSLERPELYVVRDGDWRGNPTGRRRVHRTPGEWVEDFAGHLDEIERLRERG